MNTTLDENSINVFKSHIQSFVYIGHQLIVNTNYNILYTLLDDIPKVLLNIICKYAGEEYIINCNIQNNYYLKNIEDNVSKNVCSKTICVNLWQIKVNNMAYVISTTINYEFIISDCKYNYNIFCHIPPKCIRKTNSHLELDDFKCTNEFSNILVFVVNNLIDIIINEGILVINPAYR